MDAPRTTSILKRGRLPQARQGGRARRARLPPPDSRPARPRTASRSPEMAGRSEVADHFPGVRQPGLAGVFRHRPGVDARGPRDPGGRPQPPRAARLAGRRVHGPGLGDQGPAPPDRRLGHLSPVEPGHAGGPRQGPDNRLLARGARLRVEGEVVRDIQLAASGLLNPALGGPSAMPPAPAFLFLPPSSYAPFPWVEATGPDRYRRGVYTLKRRSTPYPMLATFDVPEGNTSCVRRGRSNTPLQALTTLNETLAVESARALARKALLEGGPDDDAAAGLRLPPVRRRGRRPSPSGRSWQGSSTSRPGSSPTAGPTPGRSSPGRTTAGPATSRSAPARPNGPPTPWSPESSSTSTRRSRRNDPSTRR